VATQEDTGNNAMKISRRDTLGLAATSLAYVGLPLCSRAEGYPSRPVRIVVCFAPGGNSDIIARLIGQSLSEQLGQPFVIENRPGAGGTLCTDAVARAPADGYALLLTGSYNAVNATLYGHLNVDFRRDISQIAGVAFVPNVMVVAPSLPVASVPEFIAYAKANPGAINMASVGNGSAPHLAGELFKMMAGVDLLHIPYRGAPAALTDLLSGRVHVMFIPMSAVAETIRAGKLRALAVTTGMRSEAFPTLPTIDEFLPGYDSSTWTGLGVPRNTPTPVIEKLIGAVRTALGTEVIRRRFAELGAEPIQSAGDEWRKVIDEETEKWAKVIRTANIKVE
jgi:tripartite-type tricarboxylate transporter receptor subunit TctC